MLNSFHRFSPLMVLAGMTTYFAARGLFDFERRNGVAQNMTHVSVVPVEALDLVQHDFSIYD